MMATATSTERTRATLQEDAAALHLVEFWAQRADIELTQPRNKAVPYCWRWSDIEPRLRVAAKTVPIEECERRALVFANPGLDGKPYITNTLFAAYSLYNPGERAPVHRHTPSASRFALEGDGGFTVVEGEKLSMSRGDLILTPHGTWHDHGNDGREAVIWVDVLNVPLVESLNATRFEIRLHRARSAVQYRRAGEMLDPDDPRARRALRPAVQRGRLAAALRVASPRAHPALPDVRVSLADDEARSRAAPRLPRQPVRRHHSRICRPGHRRAGDADDVFPLAAPAATRTDAGASQDRKHDLLCARRRGLYRGQREAPGMGAE